MELDSDKGIDSRNMSASYKSSEFCCASTREVHDPLSIAAVFTGADRDTLYGVIVEFTGAIWLIHTLGYVVWHSIVDRT